MFDYPPWTDLARFAADAGGAGIDLGAFAQFGVVGVIAVLGILFAKGAHQRERDRADKAEAETQRLYTLMLDRIIPALTSATTAAEDTTELLRALQRERELTNLVHPRRPTRQSRGDDV